MNRIWRLQILCSEVLLLIDKKNLRWTNITFFFNLVSILVHQNKNGLKLNQYRPPIPNQHIYECVLGSLFAVIGDSYPFSVFSCMSVEGRFYQHTLCWTLWMWSWSTRAPNTCWRWPGSLLTLMWSSWIALRQRWTFIAWVTVVCCSRTTAAATPPTWRRRWTGRILGGITGWRIQRQIVIKSCLVEHSLCSILDFFFL